MTAAPTQTTRKHPQRIAGAILMALGASTMVGWLTKSPALFELVHGLVPMVFNTGASFFSFGLALCLATSQTERPKAIGRAVCAVLACWMLVTLAEHLLDRDLGVDLASLHTWYDYGNTRPGRMAPNSALAFLLLGVGLVMAGRVNGRKTAIATVALTFTVMTIGLVGLVGYVMAPELLFGWARSARMAVHTATGVVVAAIGLWLSWSRKDWYAGERFFHEGEKIRLLSAAVLVVVTLTAGLTGFVLLQHSFERSLEAALASTARNRGPWLQALASELFTGSGAAAEAAGLPISGHRMDSAAQPVDLAKSAENLLRAGYRSVTYKDSSGVIVGRYGLAREPVLFDAPLDVAGRVALIWHGELRVRTRHLLSSSAAMAMPVDAVEVEADESRIAPLLFGVGALGPTAQVTACQLLGDTLVCLPDELHAKPWTVATKQAPQQPLPMQRALGDERPGVVHGLDYLGHNVIAAYAKLAPGIGFVAKQDAVEAYAPIRRALALGAPVIALLALAGAAAMYSQLNPLVRRMRRSERETAAALARNVAVREAVSDGILTLDERGRIESSNVSAHAMMGFSAGDMAGLDFFALLQERTRAQFRQDFESAVRGEDSGALGPANQELQGVRLDGSEFPLEITLNAIPGPGEKLFVAVLRDITARRMAEEVLSRMAKFDALTGLPNRALFHDRLRTAVARTARSGHSLALMFLDLDGFKAINDDYGHLAGDELLKQVATRLTGVVRKTDTVARLAGDEFTIILEDLKRGPEDARQVADKAVAAMRQPFYVDGAELRVTVSVGIVLHDPRVDGAVEMSDLLKRADQSMYAVKRSGKNGFALAAASEGPEPGRRMLQGASIE